MKTIKVLIEKVTGRLKYFEYSRFDKIKLGEIPIL